ncbi:MAG TPA: peptidylprolyl isomerase [Acidimicrobiales bacterium]|nr:peptidylprolyl isomerase [Acidimicrobiales bacterium]
MPSDKRERQRQGRLARQEELRRAQEKSKRQRQAVIVVVVILVLFGVFYLLTRHSGGKKVATNSKSTTTAAGSSTTVTSTPPVSVPLISAPAGVGCPNLDGSSPHYTKFSAAPPTCIDATKTYTASMVTDAGTITIMLNPTEAPKTVNNFVFLAGYHFFDGTAFHRVIPGFVDQGGDPTGTGTGGPGYEFADELPKSASQYVAGSLAMANSGANTNGSQFFIVVGSGGSQLQPSYSLFGQVTGGMNVVTAINNDGTSSGTPAKVHKIVKVTITNS